MVRLFDQLPDVVFFIKDTDCCYTHVNQTLIQRLGVKQREDIIGKSVLQVYPPGLASKYIMQDRRVLCGEVIENLLEIQLYSNRLTGWCLTYKQPLIQDGEVVGVIGLSRDLGQPDSQHSSFGRLQEVIDHMQAHFNEPLRINLLADKAGVSVAQLERLFKRVFQITPQQLLTKLRMEAAMRALHTEAGIAEISHTCGFSDQSGFARQFKSTVGITPRAYRALVQR
nr:AraC family transcriptional regulator [Stenotrophomonas sp. SY1]